MVLVVFGCLSLPLISAFISATKGSKASPKAFFPVAEEISPPAAVLVPAFVLSPPQSCNQLGQDCFRRRRVKKRNLVMLLLPRTIDVLIFLILNVVFTGSLSGFQTEKLLILNFLYTLYTRKRGSSGNLVRKEQVERIGT